MRNVRDGSKEGVFPPWLGRGGQTEMILLLVLDILEIPQRGDSRLRGTAGFDS